MAKVDKFVIKYPDYKKFVNFIEDKYKIVLSNINPLIFFHPTNFLNKEDIKSLNLFESKPVDIPFFKITEEDFNKYDRFENFTSKNEVNNISLWALSFLRFLSGESSRLGKELEIIQSTNPRDGRLDVVSKDKKDIIILEAKTTLFNLLSEKRFKTQIPEYYKEAKKILKDKYELCIFLLIGGEESDLYPSSSIYCTTGKVGNISDIFYHSLIKYNIKFISANALWSLFAQSIITNKKYYWRDILPKIFSEKDSVGLLSSGKVVYKNKKFFVEKLDL